MYVNSQPKPHMSPALWLSSLQSSLPHSPKWSTPTVNPPPCWKIKTTRVQLGHNRRTQNPISSFERKSQFPRVKSINAICITD